MTDIKKFLDKFEKENNCFTEQHITLKWYSFKFKMPPPQSDIICINTRNGFQAIAKYDPCICQFLYDSFTDWAELPNLNNCSEDEMVG